MKPSLTTKQRLLENAFELFAKKGFDHTSIQEIIDASNVSKGAFYHYFSSKEKILDTIADQHAQKAVRVITKIANDKQLNGLEKFNRLIADLQKLRLSDKHQHQKMRQILKTTPDAKWQQKLLEKFGQATQKPFTQIFRQGVEEGVFQTPYPNQLAQFYFPFALAFKQTFFQEETDIKKLQQHLELYQDLLTRMLGAQPHSIQLAEPVLHYLKHRNHV